MAQELEHGAGPGAGTDAGAGGGGRPWPLATAAATATATAAATSTATAAATAIVSAAPPVVAVCRRAVAVRAGPAPCTSVLLGAIGFLGESAYHGGKRYRSSWSRRQDPEQERTREQSLGALATCDCGRYRVCDRGCHYDCGCGHGRGCAHCTGGTRSLPVWERALRVGFGARWLRSDS